MKTEKAELEHAREIIGWFPDKESVIALGQSVYEISLAGGDVPGRHITGAGSTPGSPVGEDGRLLGFGQFYQKLGRCHLARLVINPDFRGHGLGEEFVAALMKHGSEDLRAGEFSLYVMTANKPALNCYRSLGFELADYPDGDARLENCVFMIAGLNQN